MVGTKAVWRSKGSTPCAARQEARILWFSSLRAVFPAPVVVSDAITTMQNTISPLAGISGHAGMVGPDFDLCRWRHVSGDLNAIGL